MQRISIEEIKDRRDLDTGRVEEVEDLLQSFSRYGQLHPIFLRAHPVEKGKYEVIAGSRRFAAAKKLGWSSISAEIVDATDTDALIMTLIENEHRRDFTDYERAILIEKIHTLTKKNYSAVAELIGKSNAYVSQHVAMLHLFPEEISPDEERDKLLRSLTEGHARALLKIDDPTERWNTAKLAVKANLGIRELEKECRKIYSRQVQNRSDRRLTSVESIVRAIICGLNSKDLTPLFAARSSAEFTFFSSFPPFGMLQRQEANEHVFEVISRMDRFRIKLIHQQVIHRKDVQVAILTMQYQARVSKKIVMSPTRATLIFFRESGGWKIVHEHWSSGNAQQVDQMRQAIVVPIQNGSSFVGR